MNEQSNESLNDNEGLFVKYLEGELTTEEKLRLDELLHNSPDLQNQVTSIGVLEEELRSAGSLIRNDKQIVLDAGERLKNTLFHSNAAPANSAPALGKISTWLTGLMAISAVIVAWYVMSQDYQPSNMASTNIQHQITVPAQVQQTREPISHSENPVSRNNVPQENTKNHNSNDAEENSTIGNNISITDAPLEKQILDRINRLEKAELKHENSSDTIAHIKALYSLATLHHRVNNPLKSLAYYNQCVNLSKAIHATEMEAISLGESALLYEKLNNREEAMKRIEKCVQLLRFSNSDKVSQWETKLAKLKN